MIKSLIAIIVGLLIAAVLIGLVEIAGRFVVLPAGVDPFDAEAIKAVMPNLPPGALFFVLFGWAVGTVCGTWLAVAIARKSAFYHALPVGGVLLTAGVVEMFVLPSPLWFWILGIAVFVVSTFAGCRLGQHYLRQPPASQAPPSPS